MFPVISLGPLSIPAPALILLAGYIAGSYLVEIKANSFSMDSGIIENALWVGLISGLIGARISFIASSPSAFQGDLLSIFSLNPALLDPIGGLVIGIAAAALLISRKKVDHWKFLDSLTPFFGIFFPSIFLSRFAAGTGFGLETQLPWGVLLWGAERHPTQLYLAISSVILLIYVLTRFPILSVPPGGTFFIFSTATFSYLLFFSAFQAPLSILPAGIRPDQIIYWIGLLGGLLFLNHRINSSSPKGPQ